MILQLYERFVKFVARNVFAQPDESYENLVSFGLADALDVEQLLLGCVRYCLNGVETRVLELLDVAGADSTLLREER